MVTRAEIEEAVRLKAKGIDYEDYKNGLVEIPEEPDEQEVVEEPDTKTERKEKRAVKIAKDRYIKQRFKKNDYFL